LSALGHFFGDALPIPEIFIHLIYFFISFAVVAFLFAVIYKVLPDVHLQWADVAIGAAVTSLLFTLGKLLLGLYLGKGSVGSPYGAAGSFVVVLVWVYYSAQIFFLGAEFTRVWTHRFGSQMESRWKSTEELRESNVIGSPSLAH
jgi:membrane protein